MAEVVIKIKSQLSGDGLSKAKEGLEGVQQAAGDTSSKATGMEQVLTGAFHRIGEAAVNVAIVAAQSLGKFVTDSVGTAMNFEQQMSGVQAVLGGTGEDFDALNNLALDLGASTSYSAQQAAEGIEMLAKNGLNAEQILGGAAEASLNLAAATGGDLAQSADIMTDAMAIFGKDVGQLPEVIDGITGVTVKSKFDLQDYALALAQGGGVASAAGVNFEDFNTAIAVMSPLFASGSDAGTSFKTMLTRLVPASGPAAEAMQELGLITADGTNQFYDAEGNLKSMAEVSDVLASALGGLSDAERAAAVSTIFGSDAMRAAVALADAGGAVFEDTAESIGETSAADQAAIRLDNFAGAMEALNGAIETLKIVLGTELLPILTDIVNAYLIPFTQAIVDGVNAFKDGADPIKAFADSLSESGFKDIAQDILDIRDATVEGFGWLIENKDNIVNSITAFSAVIAVKLVPMLWAAYIPALQAAAVATWAAIAPWLPFIAIGAAVAALAWVITDNWDILTQAFTDAGGGIAGVGAALQLLGQIIWDWIVEFTGPFFTAIGQWAVGLWQWIVNAWPGVVAQLGIWWGKFTGWIGSMASAVGTAFSGWISGMWQWIVDAWESTGEALQKWWDGLDEWIAAKAIELAFAFGVWVGEAGKWLTELWPNTEEKIGNWWDDLVDWIVEYGPKLAKQIETWATDFVNWIVVAGPQAIEKLGKWLEGIGTWVTDNAEELGKKFSDWSSNLLGFIEDAATELPAAASKFAEEAWNAITGGLTDWFKGAADFGGRLMGAFFGGVEVGAGGPTEQKNNTTAAPEQGSGTRSGGTNVVNNTYNYSPTYQGAPNVAADAVLVQSMAGSQ